MLYGDIGHARIGAADLHQSRSRGIGDHPCWDAAAHRFYCAAVGFVVRTAGTTCLCCPRECRCRYRAFGFRAVAEGTTFAWPPLASRLQLVPQSPALYVARMEVRSCLKLSPSAFLHTVHFAFPVAAARPWSKTADLSRSSQTPRIQLARQSVRRGALLPNLSKHQTGCCFRCAGPDQRVIRILAGGALHGTRRLTKPRRRSNELLPKVGRRR